MKPLKAQLGLLQITSSTPASYISEDSVSHRENLVQAYVVGTTENINEATHRLIIYISVLFLSLKGNT